MPKREDGRFRTSVYLGLDENGVKQYKDCYGKSQAEADEKALILKMQMRKGIDIGVNEKFSFWADRWLEQKKANVVLTSYKNACTYYDYFNSAFGDVKIKELTIEHIQDLFNDLAAENPNTGRPTSKTTLKHMRNAARQIIEYAILNRVIDFNAAAYVKIPKIAAPAKERRSLTEREQSWIENTEHRARTPAMIMMHAGLRLGELIPLFWSDINLQEKTITVSKKAELISSYEYGVFPGAKTKAGERVVDIPVRLVEYLRSQKRENLLVSTKVSGAMHTKSSWERMWESYMAELNFVNGDFDFFDKPSSKYAPGGVPFVIEPITPHMLRHTFCTTLYLSGLDVLAAAAQMGHADPKLTMTRYTHLDRIYKRNSMAKVDAYHKRSHKRSK